MLYSRHFGWHVQERLQRLVRERHHGELLVGAAEIVETDHPDTPFLIAAPTMRVPMILRESVNAYLACRAALLLARHGTFPSGPHHGKPVATAVKSVAIPGLGTGIGRMDPGVCARQVRAAIEAVAAANYVPFPASWMDAEERHRRLCES